MASQVRASVASAAAPSCWLLNDFSSSARSIARTTRFHHRVATASSAGTIRLMNRGAHRTMNSTCLATAASSSELSKSNDLAGQQRRPFVEATTCAAQSSFHSVPTLWSRRHNERTFQGFNGVFWDGWNGHWQRRAMLSTSAGSGPIDVTITSWSDGTGDRPVGAITPQEDDDGKEDSEPSPPSSPADASAPATRQKSGDQESEERIMELQSTVRIHHRNAAYETALDTSTELLSACVEHFGQDHPATASAYNNLGLMHKMMGSFDESREAYHESLRIYGEVVGKDHASFAAALNNLGNLDRSQASSSDDDDDEEATDVEKESGGEEGDVEENPSPKKANLTALERMQLNESAIEYFDEALRIRSVELGADHPHAVASRSNLGSAMAATVLAQRAAVVRNAATDSIRAALQVRNKEGGGGGGAGATTTEDAEQERIVREAFAEAARIRPTKLTRRRWEAAAEHLRGALHTAVENPRGEAVSPLVFYEGRESEESLLVTQKKDRSVSKKDRKKAAKEMKRQKIMMNSKSGAAGTATTIVVDGIAGRVTTLSAATAAQNLAVFLKNYSDSMRLTVDDKIEMNTTTKKERLDLNAMEREARNLYESALHVRSKMLPPHHPDVVSTKFSFAELLDSSSLSDDDERKKKDGDDAARANVLREEILRSYNVTERNSS